jgi:hypothetical protein
MYKIDSKLSLWGASCPAQRLPKPFGSNGLFSDVMLAVSMRRETHIFTIYFIRSSVS